MSEVANLVSSRLTGSCSFGGKLGRFSGQLSVSPLAGNPLSAGGTRVGSTPATEFSSPTCSKLWLMVNRWFLCRVHLCPSPSLGCTTYSGKLGNSCCSTYLLLSHQFCILCYPLKVVTQTRTVYHNSACCTTSPSVGTGKLSCGPI